MTGRSERVDKQSNSSCEKRLEAAAHGSQFRKGLLVVTKVRISSRSVHAKLLKFGSSSDMLETINGCGIQGVLIVFAGLLPIAGM